MHYKNIQPTPGVSKNTKKIFLAIVTFTIGVISASCDSPPDILDSNTGPIIVSENTLSGENSKSPISLDETVMDDKSITRAVEDKLHRDPGVSFDNIDVSVKDGVVTLSGSTFSILTKERSGSLAETVRGVRAIINAIEVKPSHTLSDDEIYKNIKTSLSISNQPELVDVIEVFVAGGVVTLEGELPSWQDKSIALKRVKNVKGVKSVIDKTIIHVDEERSDEVIKTDVESALKWDALVDHRFIHVNVDAGKVHLKGSVGSMAEKSRSIVDALVLGVREVDAKELNVDILAHDPMKQTTQVIVKPDSDIKTALEKALLLDPCVPNSKIDVTVDNGKVRLGGNVHSIAAKRAAEVDARNTLGVHYVENRIKVKRSKDIEDNDIDRNICQAIEMDSCIKDSSDIEVSVKDAKVTLDGEVDSLFEKICVDNAAAGIRGTVEIDNKLNVFGTSNPLVFDPYLGDWYVHDFGRYEEEPMCKIKDDDLLIDSIRKNLLWSPFVSELDVSVTVELGIATLEGEVESWAEREAATRAALEAGAKQVVNEITVK